MTRRKTIPYQTVLSRRKLLSLGGVGAAVTVLPLALSRSAVADHHFLPPEPEEPKTKPVKESNKFPENYIDILPNWFDEAFVPHLQGVLIALTQTFHTVGQGFDGRPCSLVGTSLDEARRQAWTYVDGILDGAQQLALNGTEGGNDGFVKHFTHRRFAQALAALDIANAISPVPIAPIPAETVNIALRREAAEAVERCFTCLQRDIQGRCTEPDVEQRTVVLAGYEGENISIDELRRAESFLTGEGGERAFRLGLLRGECEFGLERFEAAATEYDALLDQASDLGLDDAQQKFLAIRSAFAHLADGDALYRQSRNIDEQNAGTIGERYDVAIVQLDRFSVAADNPLREQVEGTIQVRRAQLAGRFNFLGYHGSYVPFTRQEALNKLFERASDRVRLAKDAAAKYELFREKELDAILQEIDLEGQANVAIRAIDQAVSQEAIAEAKGVSVGAAVSLIEDQLDDLSWTSSASLSAVAGVAFTTAAAIGAGCIMGPTGTVVAVNALQVGGASGSGLAGVVGLVSGNAARGNELRHQLTMAQQELVIAGFERDIAVAQQQIGAIQLAAARDKLAEWDGATFNRNVFNALGNFYEGLLRETLDQAIRLSFIYERAVAYWYLRSDLPEVKFWYSDYVPDLANNLNDSDRITSVLVATPDQLDLVLLGIQDKAELPVGKFQVLTENNISLRERFPVEFERLLAGEPMNFEITLYDLAKMRPGVAHMRILDLGVHVVGSIPATGYGGTLTHHGISFIRDREGTLLAERFMPTDADLAKEIANIAGGAAQGQMVDGVIPLVLDADSIELSVNNEYEATAGAPNLPVPLFQGYSPAGAWTIDITGLSRSAIADVYLRWTVMHNETELEVLAPHVRNLLARYEEGLAGGERPDKILSLSLGANQDSATWTDLVDRGETSFRFSSSLFADVREMLVKAVVARAVDRNDAGLGGIRLVITKPASGFDSGEKTTLADGFTANVGDGIGEGSSIALLDAVDRFDLLGNWEVRLLDPAQSAMLGDLRLYVLYEYTPA